MQAKDTTGHTDLRPSREGVLFVSGIATALRVERGHLAVRSGEGRHIRRGRISRVSRPRLRRVVIHGKGGFTTWEALQWIEGVGASFALISRDGRIVAASAQAGPNQPALRRAQVVAEQNEIGLTIVRNLMHSKVEGQLATLRRDTSANAAAVRAVEEALVAIDSAESVRTMLAVEAKAASAYWGGWADIPMMFAAADQRNVPDHWLQFGERHSPLSTSARKAANPTGAILNYLYALAEFECRLALLAVGLDPGLGWAHRDAPYRDSAALDLLEPLRPLVDQYAMSLLRSRTFSRREFAEGPDGHVRLTADLAGALSSTLPIWERTASAHAEQIARLLARSAGLAVRVPGARTRGSRGGGASLGRRTGAAQQKARPIPSACRRCGVVLEDAERVYCPDCIRAFKEDRTARLVSAARSVLAEMRSSDRDPAQTDEAKAKRVAAYKSRKDAARTWTKENPGPHDHAVYRAKILPLLARVTLPQMMRATGLTSGYCWKIRRGERIPHPMYWDALRRLVSRE